ncbi:MAG: toll/interleukin-1 receptor domain-containing protein [Clostridia bacterium]|nr:toll/interleukin-1 receptor domain-containing protein [Clostridia bacterium]
MNCEVFISYKREVLEDGIPIRDQVMASSLYDILTAHGVKAFFSEKDLSDPEASYAIYKALHEAQILVAVATSRENLEYERTFSEWRRFRNTILNGEKPDGEIVTYLEHMTADELPFALSDTAVFSSDETDALVRWVKEGLGLTDDAALHKEPSDSCEPFEAPMYCDGAEETDAFLEWQQEGAEDDHDFSIMDDGEIIDETKGESPQKERRHLRLAAAVLMILAVISLAAVMAVILSRHDTQAAAAPSEPVVAEQIHSGYRESEKCRSITELVPTDSVKREDHLRMGVWEQDGDDANGTEYLEWRVIAMEDGKALLLTEYVIDHRAYDETESYKNADWEDCTLRHWLHEVFLKEAFSKEEREKIVPVITSEDTGDGDDTEGWDDVQDWVFMLSIEEVRHYLVSNDNAKGLVTDAAYESEYDSDERYGNWWLRSPGGKQGNTAYIRYSGSANSYGKAAISHSIGVRPAVWVRLRETDE